MCVQFNEGQEIKNIHLFNCTGQGQHGHMVAECRAEFAVLPPGSGGLLCPHSSGRVPQAVQGWMCQMSLPVAGCLCYLEMHPAPNRNNRDGSRFKALAQSVTPRHENCWIHLEQNKDVTTTMRSAEYSASQKDFSDVEPHMSLLKSYFPNPHLVSGFMFILHL